MHKFTSLAAFLVVLGSVSAVFAHSGASGIVKERMDAMKEIGAEMKLLGGMQSVS